MSDISINPKRNDFNSLKLELLSLKKNYKDFAYDFVILNLYEEILKEPEIEYLEVSIRSRALGDYNSNQLIINQFPPSKIKGLRVDYISSAFIWMPIDFILETFYFKPFTIYRETAMLDIARGLMGEELGNKWYEEKSKIELATKLNEELENKPNSKANKL